MKDVYVKKYWEEEGILFYILFENEGAARQIEVKLESRIFLDLDNPIQDDSMLYDQGLSDLELTDNDIISEDEFDQV